MEQDTHKTNSQLLDELRELRQRNSELEAKVSNLKESEERFRAIANYSYDWENWVGLDGKLKWVNPAVEKLTGYSPEEYMNMPGRLKRIVWEEDQDRIFSHFNNAIKKRQTGNDVEFQIRRKDGSLKWVSLSYQAIYNERGECLGFRSSIRDISKRKKAEEALRVSEGHFRAIAETSMDAIMISDAQNKIIFCNPAAEKMYGYNKEELIGQPAEIIVPEHLRERNRISFQNALQEEMPRLSNKPVEVFGLRKGMREFPIEMLVTTYKINNKVYFTATVRDITERKQHEEALRESEERFRAVAESSSDAILIADQNGIITFWNNAAVEMFGYEEGGIVGKSYTGLLPERLRDQDQKAWQQFFETGMVSSYKQPRETIALRKDGSEFPVEITFSSWKAKGQSCFSFIMRDISERKQAEEMLEKSEERFRLFMDNSPAIAWMKDEQGRYVYLNRRFEDRFGVRLEDWLGKTDFEHWPHPIADVFRKHDLAVLTSNNSFDTIEEAVNPNGGKCLWLVYKFPFKDADGGKYVAGMGVDITERKQQEEALRESEERFRAIAESSLDAIITVDSSGKILFWNKAAETIYGYSAEEIVGKSAEILRPEGKRLYDNKNRESFIKTGHSRYLGKAAEGLALRKDGTEFFTEISISSWKIADQIYFSGIVRDITERKQMEEELRKSHKELEKKVKQRTVELAKANKELQASKDYLKKFSGKLLSIREEERKVVSRALHDELGSMAVSVGSKISIAKEEVKDNNAKAALKSLKQGETVLRKTVADLRRLAVGLRPPNLEIMGLSGALRDYIETIKKHSKIRIIFCNGLGNKKIPDATAIVIYRLTQEALTNISKHSKAKNVRMTLNADKRNIHIDISDNGIGFDIDKIYTGKGRLKVGIAGMRERVESMGGEFSITSAPKQGTQIKATLPK